MSLIVKPNIVVSLPTQKIKVTLTFVQGNEAMVFSDDSPYVYDLRNNLLSSDLRDGQTHFMNDEQIHALIAFANRESYANHRVEGLTQAELSQLSICKNHGFSHEINDWIDLIKECPKIYSWGVNWTYRPKELTVAQRKALQALITKPQVKGDEWFQDLRAMGYELPSKPIPGHLGGWHLKNEDLTIEDFILGIHQR